MSMQSVQDFTIEGIDHLIGSGYEGPLTAGVHVIDVWVEKGNHHDEEFAQSPFLSHLDVAVYKRIVTGRVH